MIWTSLFPPEAAFALTARVAALGTTLVCAEYLLNPRALATESLMSWEVSRLRSRALTLGPVAAMLDPVLSVRGVRAMLAVRLFLALALLVFAPMSAALLLLSGLAGLVFILRTPFGHDGADQLMMIVFLALGLGSAVGTPTGMALSVAFIAAQAVLAYASAGLSKAVAPGWRDGTYLVGITGMRMYGHARFSAVLGARPALARTLALATIAWEVSFLAVPFLPPIPAFAMLAAGVAFHLGNAVVMGLNTFLFAFLATYPCLVCWIMRR